LVAIYRLFIAKVVVAIHQIVLNLNWVEDSRGHAPFLAAKVLSGIAGIMTKQVEIKHMLFKQTLEALENRPIFVDKR
jgi:hypothetical protein